MLNNIYEDSNYRIFFKDIDKYPQISGEEQLKMFKEIADLHALKKPTKKLKEKLVECNMKIVVMIAFDYANRGMANNANIMVDVHDMIQAGSLGLMQAVNKFDHTQGVLFSSYASVAIRHEIEKEIQKQRFVKIPAKHFGYLNKLHKLRDEYGDALTDSIIKKELQITDGFLKILKDNTFTNRSNDLEFETLLDLYDDEDHNFAYTAKHQTQKVELQNTLKKFVDKLKPNEKLYITDKYLTTDGVLECEIAKKYNVSRQFVNVTILRGVGRLKKLMYEEGIDRKIVNTLSLHK